VQGGDGATRLGPEAVLRVQAFDERSGLDRIEWRRGGSGAWQPMDSDLIRLSELSADGLGLRAVDRLEQVSPEINLSTGPERSD
jgi:hypothetical protein